MKTLLAVHEVEDDLSTFSPIVRLAQGADIHLNVVVLGIVRVVPVTAAPGVPAFYYNETNEEMIEAGKQRVKQVSAMLADENISATVTLECRDPAVIEHDHHHRQRM